MSEPIQEAPTMSLEEIAAYRIDLKKELDNLEFAQAKFPTKYKHDRIIRLRERLGIENKEVGHAEYSSEDAPFHTTDCD